MPSRARKAKAMRVDREKSSDNVKKLGRKIAGARAEHGFSQADVAKAAETTPARISALENATASPHIDTVARVAQVLGLEIALREPAA